MDNRWNDNDRQKSKYAEKNMATATLSTTTATWAGRELNLDPLSESLATKQPSVSWPGLWFSRSIVYSHLHTSNEYFPISLKGTIDSRRPQTGNELKINRRILSKIFKEAWHCRYLCSRAMCIFYKTRSSTQVVFPVEKNVSQAAMPNKVLNKWHQTTIYIGIRK